MKEPRVCWDCPADISQRHTNTRRCHDCDDAQRRKTSRMRKVNGRVVFKKYFRRKSLKIDSTDMPRWLMETV